MPLALDAPTLAVIVDYRSIDDVTRCLAGLADQTAQVAAHVISVGIPSDEYGAQLHAVCSPRGVGLTALAVNCGFGAAVNHAVSLRSPRSRILVLNADTAFTSPDGLLRLERAMSSDAGLAAVGPLLVDGDGCIDKACRRNLPNLTRVLAHAMRVPLGTRGYNPSPARYYEPSSAIGALNGACMLIDAEAFEAVGGFDTRFWMYGEDIDLCRSLASSGRRIGYRPDVVVHHTKGASAGRSGQGHARTRAAFRLSAMTYAMKWGRLPRTATPVGLVRAVEKLVVAWQA